MSASLKELPNGAEVPSATAGTEAGRLHRPALRLAILPDFAEEGWPSMDLCAEMLHAHLEDVLDCKLARPRYRAWFSSCPGLNRFKVFKNADRVLNRHWHYPRAVRRMRQEFDVFHVADHSYAALVHSLPAERTGVYCHDLDAFRCLLEPGSDPRPRWFRWLARRTLKGLQKAAVVFYSTKAVRNQIEQHGLVEPGKLVWAPYGIAAEFTASSNRASSPEQPTMNATEASFVLHVGSCIARKRIDVLLKVFARVRRDYPELRLVQVGGTWSDEQLRQIEQLQLSGVIMQKRGLSRAELAEHYRKARLVLQPSEAEGFGLPVAEALGCGAVVVASDLPVLREVGGEAALYVPVGEVTLWSEAVHRLLAKPDLAPAPEQRARQAAQFSWGKHARTIAEAYQNLLVQGPVGWSESHARGFPESGR